MPATSRVCQFVKRTAARWEAGAELERRLLVAASSLRPTTLTRDDQRGKTMNLPLIGTVFEGDFGTLCVSFSPDDVETARQLAATRTSGMRRGLVPTQKVSRRYSDDEVDLIGILGEVAATRALSLPSPRVAPDVDAGYDTVLPDGRTVDVKTTFGRRVLAYRAKPCRAEVAILVRLAEEEDDGSLIFELAGWTPGHDLAAWSNTPAAALTPLTAPTARQLLKASA
jgi:hypothetical protein